jgi:hypothetical protein
MFSLLSMVRKPRSEGSLEDPAALGIPQTLQTSAAGSAEERAENALGCLMIFGDNKTQ